MLNLVSNAIRFTPEGGSIDVRADVREGRFQLTVADTGHGIAAEHLHRIYDPFFTTKAARKGTGLGLSVTYGIIQEHAGKIRVESRPGNGTIVTCRIPSATRPHSIAAE